MKRIFSIMLAVILLSCFWSIPAFAASYFDVDFEKLQPGPLPIEDTIAGIPDLLLANKAFVSSLEVVREEDGNKFLEFGFKSGTTPFLYKTNLKLQGLMHLHARIADLGTSFAINLRITNNPTIYIELLKFTNNAILVNKQKVMDYTQGEWHDFDIIIDRNNKNFSVFIDNRIAARNVAFPSIPEASLNRTDAQLWMGVHNGAVANSKFLIDDMFLKDLDSLFITEGWTCTDPKGAEAKRLTPGVYTHSYRVRNYSEATAKITLISILYENDKIVQSVTTTSDVAEGAIANLSAELNIPDRPNLKLVNMVWDTVDSMAPITSPAMVLTN